MRSGSDAEDAIAEAMSRYATGDDAAFDALYTLLSDRLFGFCLRLTRVRSEADDLFQETFLKLHRARSSFVPGGAALHWAFAIARTTWLDRLRYRKRRPESVAETEEAAAAYDETAGNASAGNPEELARAGEVTRVIEAVVGKLPANQRDAYVLIREEGLSIADASRILGATPTAVKLRAHRAYEALRAGLRAAGFDDPQGKERA